MFDKDWNILGISIDKCNNQTYSGTCKSENEIEFFLKETYFYIFHRYLSVDKKIIKDDPEYFPLIGNEKAIFYDRLGSSDS